MVFRASWMISLVLWVSSPVLAGSKDPSRQARQIFQVLKSDPTYQTTFYDKEALILKQGEDYYAAFASVTSEEHPLFCIYAAKFQSDIGWRPGQYLLRPRFLCDDGTQLKPYNGLFDVKFPDCGGEFCPNPAIGVGNLLIRPGEGTSIGRFPPRIPVMIDGVIRSPGDFSLPLAP